MSMPCQYRHWKSSHNISRILFVSSSNEYLERGEGSILWSNKFLCSYVFRRVCTVCEFYTKKTKFTLRGLCRDSRHDRKFTLETNGVEKPFFKGLSTSIIKWVSFWRFLAILAHFREFLVLTNEFCIENNLVRNINLLLGNG